ncbi:nucleoporin Nup43 [Cylas formicarius]|uniref:nucleoporin Nup43 n=1 Tax=Cylas formicarius TaxID=197179 RepID=UPI0029585C6C|nr:nucleoporin Nup43 [Cylas formicarius]
MATTQSQNHQFVFSDVMSYNVHGNFVSEKISKIRWRPDGFNESNSFVTGSADNDVNNVRLWEFCEIEEDIFPIAVASLPYCGDVTEIKFLNPNYFVSSSSSGSVHLQTIVTGPADDVGLKQENKWTDIHYFFNGDRSSCTGLALYESDIVTVGEDGRINLLTAQMENVVRTIENADSCSIQSVIFMKHNEILTSNLRAQMKIWDLRVPDDKPSNSFMLNGDQVIPTCLAFHPNQRHLVIAGDELGALSVWDLRHDTFPVNVFNAHEGSISEIQFNRDDPNKLFSCSSAGEVWHWASKGRKQFSSGFDEDASVWLVPGSAKSNLEVFTLMSTIDKPINSLDMCKGRVICGCDNEAIYLINGPDL